MKFLIHLKKCYFLLLTFCLMFSAFGQETPEAPSKIAKPFFLDYIMGPYLFIDHIPYDAVMMNGCRFGYQFKPKLNVNIEYVVGQQQDDQNTLGMTHNVNAQLSYFFKPTGQRFDPYLFLGGGFFEFKAFSTDVYGISYHAGAGTTVRFTKNIRGLFEARYLNLGLMDLGGKNELAVFWGARIHF